MFKALLTAEYPTLPRLAQGRKGAGKNRGILVPQCLHSLQAKKERGGKNTNSALAIIARIVAL